MEAADINLIEIAGLLSDEEEAIRFFESIRWPEGPVCPHCNHQGAYKIQANASTKVRKGLWKCSSCRKQYTVRVGTIFEDSKISLGKWLMALHLMCSSKRGISALQLKRNLKVAYQTAWFMCHRIRYAMTQEPLAGLLRGTVEVDETYVGGKPRKGGPKRKEGRGTEKTPVMVLVERGGRAQALPVDRVDGKTLHGEIRRRVHPSSRIHTEEWKSYTGISQHFEGGHETINHKRDQYATRLFGELITTNSAESFFALMKRGHYGVFHQLSNKHLHRYCDEFSFRWSYRDLSDGERTVIAIMGSVGKRLMYKEPASTPSDTDRH
jgi:transposase-like protein